MEKASIASVYLMQSIFDFITEGVAILNGVVGDYFKEQGSNLAIPMCFYHDKKPLLLTTESILRAHPKVSSKICIFIHGLCITERSWEFRKSMGTNYGSLLKEDLGCIPFYLRYNTGLHISENAKDFLNIMTELLKVYPVKVTEIILIGHSQGGLMIRSACHYGEAKNLDWIKLISRTILLGTPHLGAPFEKFGNALTYVLKRLKIPFLKPLADFINFRSAAIKDLRYGYTLDEEWQGRDPDALWQNHRQITPLLAGASHYIAAASLTKDVSHPICRCLGDIWVRIPSALCLTQGNSDHPNFLIRDKKIFYGINHYELARSREVYRQIKSWCMGESPLFHDKDGNTD
ncbi:MAG: alpha/beta fold hydrolase [Desulfobacterales bacterium]|nr:alpha/beta fold hydrolase [Desulfobacterales bacterium]